MISDEELDQLERDALERYWRALELADGVRQAWEADGKLLRGLERDALRCAQAVARKPGRPGRRPRFEGVFANVPELQALQAKSANAKLRRLPPPLAT